MGLLAVPADHAHGSGPSPEVDGAVRTNKTTTWNSYRVRSPSLGVSRPASGHECLELWWGEGREKLLARRPTDLLAGVGGDGQSVGKESRHFVFFDQLHRYHRNDHLRERERERGMLLSGLTPQEHRPWVFCTGAKGRHSWHSAKNAHPGEALLVCGSRGHLDLSQSHSGPPSNYAHLCAPAWITHAASDSPLRMIPAIQDSKDNCSTTHRVP